MFPRKLRSDGPHSLVALLAFLAWSTAAFSCLTACRAPESGGRRRNESEAETQYAATKATLQTCADLSCMGVARCSMTSGTPECVCPRGFEGPGDACTDIDECANADLNECDEHADCVNRDGSYDCECKSGFTGDGRTCANANTCKDTNNACHTDAICSSEGDGIMCMCKPGFEGNGFACRDVDECAGATGMCAPDATCQNRRGSYACSCELPFVGDGKSECRDACSAALQEASVCDPHGRCAFASDGKAACNSCQPGYVGDGKSCKADSACAALGCTANAVCAGSGADLRCECAPGFEGDPKGECRDIDECGDADRCAGKNSRCINTTGGYICGCSDGFELVDGECKNIDECAKDSDLCDPNADCEDTSPGYNCKCKAGFEGDGRACADIDECAKDAKICSTAGTVCRNKPGTYECACPAGFLGNGKDEACACDLNGVWGVRIDTEVEVRELSAADVVLISGSKSRTYVWELNRFTWDGKQLKVENKNCGMSRNPEIFSPLYTEVYSLEVPHMVYDTLDLEPAQAISLARADALPGKRYITKPEGVLYGLKLDDPLADTWYKTWHDVPANAWTDYDKDGEPGMSFWPIGTELKTQANSDVTYDYLPVELKSGSSLVSMRVGCASVGIRMIRSFDGKIESCGRIRGHVEIPRFDAHVHSCTIVRMSDWETGSVACSEQDWAEARRCTDEQVDFIDEQELPRETSGEFELVKLGSLENTDIDCAKVRAALPALPR